MFKQSLLEEVLGCALSSGGDFDELYVERTHNNNIRMVDGKSDKV